MANQSRIVVGVISDTHGLLRPEALVPLQGSDLIIHAGDVGDPEILDRLREIAPTFAVRGNIDTSPGHRRCRSLRSSRSAVCSSTSSTT
jgi:putative phosphoesterase